MGVTVDALASGNKKTLQATKAICDFCEAADHLSIQVLTLRCFLKCLRM